MTWNTLTNLTTGQLVTETHMDQIRENIEHVGDNVLIGGVDAKTLTTTTSASRMATGTYTGDGNATQAITGVGFQPDKLMVFYQTSDNNYGIWIKTDQDGTKAKTNNLGKYEDDHIISLDSDGFTVGDGTGSALGTPNQVNTNTNVYAYIAWIA